MVYRAALIGCGNIGSDFDGYPGVTPTYSHAGAYTACEQTELVAVCDIDSVKVRGCAEKWNTKGYLDVQLMLDDARPNIVSICSPDPTHYDMLRTVLDFHSVRAVLSEKPLTLDVAQAHEIVEQARRRDVRLAVNYTRRYSRRYLELREFVSLGKIGKIHTVSGYYTKGIIHNGTHWIDLARFVLGDIVGVLGFGSQGDGGLDPTLDALFTFSSGAKGYLLGCSWADEISFFEMDLLGDLGRVLITDSGQSISFYELAKSPHYAGYKIFRKTREVDGELPYAMLNAVKDLVLSLDRGGEPRCSGRDGVAALKIACAVRDSARSGSPIRVD
jgi:predicted dehydrogenase